MQPKTAWAKMGRSSRFIAVALVVSFFKCGAIASPVPADDEIARLMVGLWIADPNLPDAIRPNQQEVERHTMTTYRADHTGTVSIFSDVTCQTVIRSVDFVWSVNGGTMTFHLAGGAVSYDVVESIDPKLMVLHVADGSTGGHVGLLERRVRAVNCATPE
jgi:hypothetical protein